ncbi:MAG: glycoside hydrolase family 32 protein, partial [Oscillospiraceae bacterium]|nr:glycoside hydrolase family 32 protein [Oscillospiraceae bacterium]
RMHWGHAVSKDMTNWEHLDTALFPTKTDDCDGCFSGSAIEHDGQLHILYTGVRYEQPDPENINCCRNDGFVSAQLHTSSADGYSFDNFKGKTTVVPPLENPELGCKTHTRDPKVWKGSDGNFYMVLGTTVNSIGRLLFYKSENLIGWEYVNSASNPNYGWMWECPDYFRAGDSDVLIFSPMGIKEGNQAVCVLTEFDESNCEMKIPDSFQFLDYGLDLYAPQSTLDSEGRRTVIAWLRMPEPMDNGTIGMFCIPRICEVKNGHIYFRPHPNVRSRFTRKINSPEKTYMIKAELAEDETINVGGFIVQRKNGRIVTDRSGVIRGHNELKNICETPELKDGYSVEIYADENIIEVFVNDGEYVITNTVYDLTDKISYNENAEIYALEE